MSAGSNVESRSRGISNGQSPAGVITVFALLPLRWLPVFPCALCSARGWFSSASSIRSANCFFLHLVDHLSSFASDLHMTSSHKIPDRLREYNRRFRGWARHEVLTPITR